MWQCTSTDCLLFIWLTNTHTVQRSLAGCLVSCLVRRWVPFVGKMIAWLKCQPCSECFVFWLLHGSSNPEHLDVCWTVAQVRMHITYHCKFRSPSKGNISQPQHLYQYWLLQLLDMTAKHKLKVANCMKCMTAIPVITQPDLLVSWVYRTRCNEWALKYWVREKPGLTVA